VKKKIIFGVIMLLVVVLVVFLFPGKESREINVGQRVTGNLVQKTPATNINYGNLPSFLSKNSVIKDIPDNIEILFRFYNFNSGSRAYEKTFILTKGSVVEGELDNPDLYLDIHSKYLNEWNSGNFCQIMTKANNNGDMGISSELSTAKLLWKFKSMNEHKSCFGL
jgi:hypothetical protein